MAKQSGLGDQLFIGGYDIGADTSAISSLSTPRATLPATGITSSANERMFGLRDGHAEFTTFFNPGPVGGPVANEHLALRGLPTADTGLMYLRGAALGNEAFCMTCKQIDYNPTRGDDGSLTFGVTCEANAYGADWTTQCTAGKQTDASASNTTSVDFLVGTTNFGFVAYCQVFSIGSGTPTVKLQTSSDNGGGDAFADLTDGSFGVVTAPGVYRIQSSSATLAVERYIRVVTTGSFTNLVYCVGVLRYDAARAL